MVMGLIFAEFLKYIQGIGLWLKVSAMNDEVYIQNLGQIVAETLGFMALKEEFKVLFLDACRKEQGKDKSEFVEYFNYLIVSAIQYTAPGENQKGDGDDMIQSNKLKTVSSIIFFFLNMVRSTDYDIMMPSHTLQIQDKLKDKETSYYELKQVNKLLQASPQLVSHLTSKFENEYGTEKMVSKLRKVLLEDFNLLNVINGQVAVSRIGPKSAVDQKNMLQKKKVRIDKNYELFDAASYLQARDLNIAKSKRAGVYLKHMVSEIMLLLACNKDEIDEKTGEIKDPEEKLNLVPILVINNAINFLFDLRQSIFEETSSEHDLAVEADINIQ